MPASRCWVDRAAAVWRSLSQSGGSLPSVALRFRLRALCKVRRALRNAAAQDRGILPALLTTTRAPRRGVQKSGLIKYAARLPCWSAPRSAADIPLRRDVGAVSGPRPGRSAWREPLIATPDRRRLVDDLAHRRRALFGSFQVFEDYRQRG